MPPVKSIIFYQNSPKIRLILKKCKIFKRWGSAPRPSCLRRPSSWGLCHQTPQTVPSLRISGYTPGNFSLFIIICFFVAFVLSNFFLIVQLQPYDVNYVCLKLKCFLFEKFYLHYALCDFDSIL